MNTTSLKRFARRSAVVLIVASLVAGCLVGVAHWQRLVLQTRLAARLAAATADEAAEIIAAAVATGAAGTDLVVAGIAHSDPQVADEAARQVVAMLDDWALRPPADDLRLRVLLVETLLARQPAMPPHGRQRAADVAIALLRRQDIAREAQFERLAAGCEQLVRNSLGDGSARGVATSAWAHVGGPAHDRHRLPLPAADGLPGHVGHVGPGLWPALGDMAAGTAQPGGTEPGGASAGADHAPPSTSSASSAAANAPSEPRRFTPPPFGMHPLRSPPPAGSAAGADLAASAAGPDGVAPVSAQPREKQSTIELFRQLHRADAATESLITAELKRRGFTPRLLEVCRRLTDPSPEVRRQWARMLPGITGLDGPTWLVHLSHDHDAEVRLTAMGLLATSGSPRLLDRVAQMARDDSDPRVRAQAARALQPAQGSQRAR